ncbi:hypothetical protein K490DRAFT_34975 [Saccharata proteae CBS 121410]|uniref:RING-type domain-containing protein n=1 Tax=Saccharata proteae CBS 121410 TaxID=1314787 RepID=A0A9P4HYY0_9PEZI|nr:hypothetical protein K490DRAFT_34975 [Saccharata proteae CBS 121410]
MSNPAAVGASKSANTPGQLSPAQSQGGAVATGDSFGQRRSGGSGSFGAGANSRSNSSPRNNQASKKQHKGSKKFRLADDDAIAESLAMRSTSSRKGQTSITHLMNFSLPPRPQNHHTYGSGRLSRRNPTWGLGSGYHAVDKARYVHANYRFIVDPRADYHAQNLDADTHLDWNNVLQILASSQSQSASCPICLGTPVAPRMARCGHIFCLPCLIRYMHSEDEAKPPEKRARSKKCPICEDSVYMSDTRPVRWYMGQEGEPPREGGDVVLRLIMRSSGNTLALPRDGADALPTDDDIPWFLAAEVMDYARVMKGSEDYMLEQFDNDIQAVELQSKEDEVMFGDDVQWARRAVKMINEAKEKVKGIGNPPSLPAKPHEPKTKRQPVQLDKVEESPEMYLIQQAVESGQSLSDNSATPQTSSSTEATFDAPSSADSQQPAMSNLSKSLAQIRSRQQNPEHQTPSEYFFYQALLHYYLSPLDIRILKAAFGNFSSFPSTILPRVERVSTGHIVDDDLRKRTKYLAHLPYGCEVGFLECDWTDTVAPEVLEKFGPEIERRRKKNHEKESKEEKARIRAEKEEDQKNYAAARRKRPSNSINRFSADEFVPLVPSEAASEAAGGASMSVDAESASTSPPWPRRQGSAFASLASPSTSPSAPRTVWGTTAVAGASPTLHATMHDQEPTDDGWLQGWERDLMQEEQMLAQAQALSLGNGEGSSSGATGGGGGYVGGGGKKKKAKKITLMSTGVRRQA